MTREELLKAFKDEQTDNDYSLITNKNSENKEFMILKKEHVKGAKLYYPEKDLEIILESENLKNILNKVEEIKPTDYDVIFIDNFDIEIFYLIEQYILTFTGVKSIIIDSRCRVKEAKAKTKEIDKIKENIDNTSGSYKISLFDELILEKDLKELEEYAKEKNIEIKLNKKQKVN